MLKDGQQHENFMDDIVYVSTLGCFDIVYRGRSIFEDTSRSYKSWELFKYLLTYKEKMLIPEHIAESLWPDNVYTDPKNAISTQIFRLRRLLDANRLLDNTKGKYFTIESKNGCYVLNVGHGCIVDSYELERLYAYANTLDYTFSSELYRTYREIVDIYKGIYLPDLLYDEWVIPMRSRYHRLFLNSLTELLYIMKDREEYDEILFVCEDAFVIEPLEEKFHLFYMDALVQCGREQDAIRHYGYVTSKIYRELRINPSHEMRKFYSDLKKGDKPKLVGKDLSIIVERLNETREEVGATLCDVESFKVLFNIEKRRAPRTTKKVFIGMITIVPSDRVRYDMEAKIKASEELKATIETYLRKGDVYTMVNREQFLIMLPNMESDNVELIIDRISWRYKENSSAKDFDLEFKFQPIT